jgi:hypothetical protein
MPIRGEIYPRWNKLLQVENFVNMPPPLTSAQIRAARALIRWSAADLAKASSVGATTIRRAELAVGETSMTAPNNLAIRRALEAAGVEFIDANGGGPGVRIRENKAEARGLESRSKRF